MQTMANILYKYMIFEVISPINNNSAAATSKNDLKEYLNKFEYSNLIYPTHDEKVYVVFKETDYYKLDDLLKKNNDELKITTSQIKLKRFHLDDSKEFVSIKIIKDIRAV
jgi:hypothetical protein